MVEGDPSRSNGSSCVCGGTIRGPWTRTEHAPVVGMWFVVVGYGIWMMNGSFAVLVTFCVFTVCCPSLGESYLPQATSSLALLFSPRVSQGRSFPKSFCLFLLPVLATNWSISPSRLPTTSLLPWRRSKRLGQAGHGAQTGPIISLRGGSGAAILMAILMGWQVAFVRNTFLGRGMRFSVVSCHCYGAVRGALPVLSLLTAPYDRKAGSLLPPIAGVERAVRSIV